MEETYNIISKRKNCVLCVKLSNLFYVSLIGISTSNLG
jgi:hypothetical protein